MKTWSRRNLLGIGLTLIGLLIFGLTTGYPAWRNNLGDIEPEFTVPAGATVKIDEVLWRMRIPDIPTPTYKKADNPQPPLTRLVAYAFDRSRDSKPASLSTEWAGCSATVIGADGRRWNGQIGLQPISLIDWARRQGYSSGCDVPGAFVTVMTVPKDAVVAAVEINFIPTRGSKKHGRAVQFIAPS